LAMAADVAVRPAVYTRTTATPAPTTTLDLPMQIPTTLNSPVQVTGNPTITTVGWRRYGYYPAYGAYRPYYGAYRPYYRPYYAYRPYYYPAPYRAYYAPYGAYYGGPYVTTYPGYYW
jgi:hypothetical protein